MWPVPLVIWIRSRQLFEHILRCRTRPCRIQPRSVSVQLSGRNRVINSRFVKLQYTTYLALHILRVVLPVHVACGCFVLQCQGCVSYLSGQAVLQIEQTRLADVLDLCASLTDDGRLEAHAVSRIPAEDCERSSTCPTFASEFLFRL